MQTQLPGKTNPDSQNFYFYVTRLRPWPFMSFTSTMADNEPNPPLDSDENVNADTSVEAASDSAPDAKEVKANFKWNADLRLALANVVG